MQFARDRGERRVRNRTVEDGHDGADGDDNDRHPSFRWRQSTVLFDYAVSVAGS
jgi:hypothetical protein